MAPGHARSGIDDRDALESEETRRAAMAEAPFTIGAEASCTDGACGALARIIIAPVAADPTEP
jgi:hypothetical protein